MATYKVEFVMTVEQYCTATVDAENEDGIYEAVANLSKHQYTVDTTSNASELDLESWVCIDEEPIEDEDEDESEAE